MMMISRRARMPGGIPGNSSAMSGRPRLLLLVVENAKDISELLDSAAGVSILAWTSTEVAAELWVVAGEWADADGAAVSLSLCFAR